MSTLHIDERTSGRWEARITINGQAVPPGPRFRQGIVRDTGGRQTMVIWLELESVSDTEVMVERGQS